MDRRNVVMSWRNVVILLNEQMNEYDKSKNVVVLPTGGLLVSRETPQRCIAARLSLRNVTRCLVRDHAGRESKHQIERLATEH